MTPPALIPDELLLKGVSITAWPDGPMKSDRRNGKVTKKPDPNKDGSFVMFMELDDGRTFTDPEFAWLAN